MHAFRLAVGLLALAPVPGADSRAEAGGLTAAARPRSQGHTAKKAARAGGRADRARGGLFDSRPIESGFVIFQGRYLPAPYVVGVAGDQVVVNGQPIPTPELGDEQGPGPERRRSTGAFTAAMAVERVLLNRGLLLIVDAEAAHLFPHALALQILACLDSDPRGQRSVERLDALGAGRVGASQVRWLSVVEHFRPDGRLTDRLMVESEDELSGGTTAEAVSATVENVPGSPLGSAGIRYGITIVGMVMAVLACGALLVNRPTLRGAWSQVDRQGAGFRLLPRYMGVIALLALFDLACTLIVNQSSMFWEMNPLGRELFKAPAALAVFKLTATGLGLLILLRLRAYRGAQLASWWACFVCTLVTFRWASFGSLFMD